jgi:hypothetical protein
MPAYLNQVARDLWMRGGYPDASVPPPTAVLPPNLLGISAMPSITPTHTPALPDPVRWPALWVPDATAHLAMHASHQATLSTQMAPTMLCTLAAQAPFTQLTHADPHGPSSFMAAKAPLLHATCSVSFSLTPRSAGCE